MHSGGETVTESVRVRSNLHDICLAGNIRQRLVEPFRNMQPLALMQGEKEGDNGGLLSHHAF